MSLYYDDKHKPVSFQVGQKVYINLQKKIGTPGYRLPNTDTPKLSQQRVSPFAILQKVGQLAYELDIPKNWGIHSTVSVTHLKLIKENTYARSPPVLLNIIKDDDESHEEWEIEEILRSQ